MSFTRDPMRAIPYILFVICAGLAGVGGDNLFLRTDMLHEQAALLLIFFGLAVIVLPLVVAIDHTNWRQWTMSSRSLSRT